MTEIQDFENSTSINEDQNVKLSNMEEHNDENLNLNNNNFDNSNFNNKNENTKYNYHQQIPGTIKASNWREVLEKYLENINTEGENKYLKMNYKEKERDTYNEFIGYLQNTDNDNEEKNTQTIT